MPLYRYVGDPDDDDAPPPVVAGRSLKVGDATTEDVRGDRRFVEVLDPAAAPAAAPVKKPRRKEA